MKLNNYKIVNFLSNINKIENKNRYLKNPLVGNNSYFPIQHRKIAETLQNDFTEPLQYCMMIAKRC